MIFACCKTTSDCVAACIASIIERQDVPHCFDGRDSVQSWADLRAYLKSLGMTLFLTAFDENPIEWMGQNNPDTIYMLLCQFNSEDHAVICKGGTIAHDPAWYKGELTGPNSHGEYIIGIVSNA